MSAGFQRLRAAMRSLDGIEGRVGYFAKDRYPDKDATPVAYVAAVHEIGHAPAGIPPRPTLAPTIGDNIGEYNRLFASGARSILAGKSEPIDVMEKVMLRAASDVSTAISRLTTPPLRPATIARKGHAKPLDDTGLMGQSVTGTAERTK